MTLPSSNIWKITLNDPWFHHVQSGEKTYEGRRYWGKTRQYQVGDFFEINHHTNSEALPFTAQILEIRIFKSFEKALQNLPIQQVLPGVSSVADGVAIYQKYVSLSTQEKNGVCMIKLKICEQKTQ
jgi:ASC-1-like (ASCH) protein